MKKKLLFTTILATTIMSTNIFGAGVSNTAQVIINNVDILVDGQRIDADNILYNDTTYLP